LLVQQNAEMFLQKSEASTSLHHGQVWGPSRFFGRPMIQSILGVDDFFETNHLAIGSIYGIFTHIWLKFMVTSNHPKKVTIAELPGLRFLTC